MSKQYKSYVAFYGSVVLQRGYCAKCRTWSIILKGKFICCDAPVDKAAKKFYREAEAAQVRRRPNQRDQRRILEEQNYSCFYCESRFGWLRWRHGLPVTLQIEWDHQIPYVFSQNNKSENFVAACHVCNRLKSGYVFDTLDRAREFLRERRKAKGYNW